MAEADADREPKEKPTSSMDDGKEEEEELPDDNNNLNSIEAAAVVNYTPVGTDGKGKKGKKKLLKHRPLKNEMKDRPEDVEDETSYVEYEEDTSDVVYVPQNKIPRPLIPHLTVLETPTGKKKGDRKMSKKRVKEMEKARLVAAADEAAAVG